MPLPLIATQILWTNLITDGLIDEALIFENPEKDIMERPPRPLAEKFITPVMIRRIITIGLSIILISFLTFRFYLENRNLEYSRTVIFALTSFFSIFGVYTCRSLYQSSFQNNPFTNMYLNYAAIATALVQILVLYTPSLRTIFSLSQLSVQDFLIVICLAFSLFLIMEIEKFVENKIPGLNKNLA
jgi:Ca2+-transporting ATPase